MPVNKPNRCAKILVFSLVDMMNSKKEANNIDLKFEDFFFISMPPTKPNNPKIEPDAPKEILRYPIIGAAIIVDKIPVIK